MFFDKYNDVKVEDLAEFIDGIDSVRWTFHLWNYHDNDYDTKDAEDIVEMLRSDFEEGERLDISANLNVGSRNRLYIKHSDPNL